MGEPGTGDVMTGDGKYAVSAQELMNYAAPVIEHFRTGADIAPSMWMMLATGDTIVVPGTDWDHYDDHSEWPVLLMTGPDPAWLLQWWMPDLTVGGDEWVDAQTTAREQARTATDGEWLQVCQRAIDEQLAALAAQLNTNRDEHP